jgi:hypothetical protein
VISSLNNKNLIMEATSIVMSMFKKNVDAPFKENGEID